MRDQQRRLRKVIFSVYLSLFLLDAALPCDRRQFYVIFFSSSYFSEKEINALRMRELLCMHGKLGKSLSAIVCDGIIYAQGRFVNVIM